MSPLVMIIIAAALLVLLQFLLGVRGSAETRRVYAYLLRDARQRARRSFSIIVPLERRAETLYPLLDHLYQHEYDKLQIIVVVKQTAGSRAVADLQKYRRQQRRKNLKIVRYQRGMTETVIARRHARNDYVLSLTSDDRLSPQFFMVASQVLVASNTDALAVRSLARPTRTFAQAFWSLASLLRVTKAASTGSALPGSYRITRRRALQDDEAQPTVYAAQQFYVTTIGQTAPSSRLSWLSLIVAVSIGLAAAIAYAVTAFLLDTTTAQLYGWILLVTLEAATLLCMMQFKGYTFFDYLNIALFVPLSPLYALGQIILRAARAAVNAARRQRLSTQR